MNLELMKTLTTFNVSHLYRILVKFLRAHEYKDIKKDKNYLYAEGTIPVCLIAHMDTVFKYSQTEDNFIYDPEKEILWGIGGSGFDDRAGIYAIIELILRGHRPHVIFTDLEEVGGIGANDLITRHTKCPFKDCRFLIQLDRANEKDAVYYSCANEDFETYIESFGFVADWGTFSDISIIAPAWNLAAVNLSVGYEMEHTKCEILHTNWLDATIDKVEEILYNAGDAKHYEYVPAATRVYGNIVPKFTIKDDECLICGSKLNPHTAKHIYDDTFPYSVCPQCFMQYYLDDETPDDQIPFS